MFICSLFPADLPVVALQVDHSTPSEPQLFAFDYKLGTPLSAEFQALGFSCHGWPAPQVLSPAAVLLLLYCQHGCAVLAESLHQAVLFGVMPDTPVPQAADSPLARRGSAAASGSLVKRLGSYTGAYQWESWEHPANIPLHPPAQPQAPDTAYEPLGDQQEQHSQAKLMISESKQ